MFEILIDKIDNLSEKQDSMGARLDSVDLRLDKMDTILDHMEMRQDEIFSVVKAIEHSNAAHKAVARGSLRSPLVPRRSKIFQVQVLN